MKTHQMLLLIMLGALCALPTRADTLAQVKKNGAVHCGVSQGVPGFSFLDDKGNWSGLDVDLCGALAAAIFGDAKKIKITGMSTKERFTALTSKEVDVLTRNTTWTMHRDTALGIDFTAVNYYDGQSFMVRKELGVKSTNELDGASLCTNTGTTTELNVADYFRTKGMKYELVVFEKTDQAMAAYEGGRCDAYTTDQSALYAHRLRLKSPQSHIILPEIISKEPLTPVVRQGDDRWADIVAWTHYAMLNAEELGVTMKNAKALRASSKDPAVRRLLGRDGTFGKNLGLSNDWAFHIIAQVGNYGEVFARTVGLKSPLKIKRGMNALWRDGGLQYAPPIR